jgi:hypothetical protein
MEPNFMALLALAFGAWAGVVGFIGHGIRMDLKQIGVDLKIQSKELSNYIIQTETRLARIEQQIETRY